MGYKIKGIVDLGGRREGKKTERRSRGYSYSAAARGHVKRAGHRILTRQDHTRPCLLLQRKYKTWIIKATATNTGNYGNYQNTGGYVMYLFGTLRSWETASIYLYMAS